MTLVMFYEQDVMVKRSSVASVMARLIPEGLCCPPLLELSLQWTEFYQSDGAVVSHS